MERFNTDSYEAFRASLHTSDEFVAEYMSAVELATWGKTTNKRKFVIRRLYDHIMEVETIKNVKINGDHRRVRVICYVNIKELYLKGSKLVVNPTRQELIEEA